MGTTGHTDTEWNAHIQSLQETDIVGYGGLVVVIGGQETSVKCERSTFQGFFS